MRAAFEQLTTTAATSAIATSCASG